MAGGEDVSASEVRLRILGEHGAIDPRALQRAISGLLEMLDAAGVGSWVITDLREGSAELAIASRAADQGAIDAAFRSIIAGFDVLENFEVLPDKWNLGMIHGLINASEVEELSGAEGLELSFSGGNPKLVSEQIKSHAIVVAGTTHVSIGSVRGRIHRWVSKNGRREIGLVDETSGRSIKVLFRASIEDRVKEVVGEDVRAWGELRRDAEGKKTELKLDDFDILPDHEGVSSIEEIVGVLGTDWTGDRSTLEWIRDQRDDG